jgi:hypothetical protein
MGLLPMKMAPSVVLLYYRLHSQGELMDLELAILNYQFFSHLLLLLPYSAVSAHHLLLYSVVWVQVHSEPSGNCGTVELEQEPYCSYSQEMANIFYLDLKLLPLSQTSPGVQKNCSVHLFFDQAFAGNQTFFVILDWKKKKKCNLMSTKKKASNV